MGKKANREGIEGKTSSLARVPPTTASSEKGLLSRSAMVAYGEGLCFPEPARYFKVDFGPIWEKGPFPRDLQLKRFCKPPIEVC